MIKYKNIGIKSLMDNNLEEPLPAGGSCLLGSINLSEFVIDPFTSKSRFDIDSFNECVRVAVMALNDVLDEGLPLHPLQEQRDSVRDLRQIGLGIMGLADMLIKLGIRYGSGEALSISSYIGKNMINVAISESSDLAITNGEYPLCNRDEILKTDFVEGNCWTLVKKAIKDHGLRNSQLLTIAPTGSLSTMLGVSGGIEPIYANYYERKTESLMGRDEYYKVYTPIVKEFMKFKGIDDDSLLPDYFVTSMTINYNDRINMQSKWQYCIDASISSTVNVPNSFTIEEVESLYKKAWEYGLKGITIFRDGCKRVGVLSTDTTKPKNDETTTTGLKRGEVVSVNDNVIGRKRKLVTGCGSLHCVALFSPENGDLLETYLSRGSTGGCNNFMIGLSRMISLSARAGIPLDKIVDQLNSTGNCPSYAVRRATHNDTSIGSCCPMAVGRALIDMHDEVMSELKDVPKTIEKEIHDGESEKQTCPQCGEPLAHEAGCVNCKSCGWSKCE